MKTSIVMFVLGCGAMCAAAAVGSRGSGAQPIAERSLRAVQGGGPIVCAKTYVPPGAMTGCMECFEDGVILIWIDHPPYPPGGHWQLSDAWKRCDEGGTDEWCETFQMGAFNWCDWTDGECPNPNGLGSERYLDNVCHNGTQTYTSCTATYDKTVLTPDLNLPCNGVTNGEKFPRQ